MFWSLIDGGGGEYLINVLLRVYYDVFGQSSRFNFRPGVFVDSRGGGRQINVFLRVYFDVYRQSLRFYLQA